MGQLKQGTLEEEGAAALKMMEQALELLDCCEDVFDVGAHLDLAICRLRDAMERAGPTTSIGQQGEIRS